MLESPLGCEPLGAHEIKDHYEFLILRKTGHGNNMRQMVPLNGLELESSEVSIEAPRRRTHKGQIMRRHT